MNYSLSSQLVPTLQTQGALALLAMMVKQLYNKTSCTKAGLIRGGILFLDATYATCSVGLRTTLYYISFFQKLSKNTPQALPLSSFHFAAQQPALNQHRLRSDFTVKFIVFTHRFVCDFVWRACLRVRPLTTSL